MSVFAQFKAHRDRRPDAPAFLIAAGDRSVPITWRTFARDIENLAWLVGHFAPHATIGLLGENSYEWITAHAAGLFVGATVVPIEVNLTPEEIAERLVFTGAKALVHSALYREKAHAVGALVPGLITAGFGSPQTDAYMQSARKALDAGAVSVFDQPPRDENEVATLVFTSGTTSKPRAAELTLAGLATFVEFAATRLPMKPGDRSLMLLPLHHIYGLATTYLMLAKGVALGVCPDFRRFCDAVARFRADFLCLVPALAEILAAKIARRGASAEEALGVPVDWVLSGGAPLPRRTESQLEALGMRVLQIYGLTETFALYAMSPYDDPRPGSVGLGCDGFAGMEAKSGPNGELLVRGPAVLRGYYKEPQLTARVLTPDGWFDTGDVGRIDADGYVWVTGRRSRTIVLSSGKKVAPEELEERLLSIPGVHEALVSGNGETRELHAEIYSVVSEETVRRQVASLNRLLPVHKRIRSVSVRTEPFPRTASGKIKVGEPVRTEAARVVEDVETSVRIAPPPVAPQDDTLPSRRRRISRPAKGSLALIAGTAVFVLLENLLRMMLPRCGVTVPGWLAAFLDFAGEWGEILLAILVIPAVFVVYDVYRNLVKRDEG